LKEDTQKPRGHKYIENELAINRTEEEKDEKGSENERIFSIVRE